MIYNHTPIDCFFFSLNFFRSLGPIFASQYPSNNKLNWSGLMYVCVIVCIIILSGPSILLKGSLGSHQPHTQAPSTSSAIIGQLRPSMTAESAQPQAPPIAPPTPSYSASSIPQLAASLVLSQGQHQPHQANALPHQSMATVYPMLQKSAALPNQTTLLSPQATLINPALGYPFNPIVPAFGSFVPMQNYATSPVCLPGFLPGISSTIHRLTLHSQ